MVDLVEKVDYLITHQGYHFCLQHETFFVVP